MRIAQVSPFLPGKAGGSVVYSTNLSRELANRGHDVEFFAANYPANGHDSTAGLGNQIRMRTSPCFGLMMGINPVSFILRKLIRTKADVVHAHSYIFSTSNQAALASRLSGRPLVLHIHGATYARHSMMARRTASALYLKEKIYDRTLGKWTIASADAIAAVSKFDLQKCKEVFGVEGDKLHLIPNAVDAEVFRPSDETRDGPPVVTFIGRLEQWKGASSFMTIARMVRDQVPEARFMVVGDGSMKSSLTSEFQDLLPSTQFVGEVAHRDIPAILHDTTVLVLPSYIEGLPTVCLEALACGIPVVASDTGGTSEVILDGETGFLRPVDDLPGFADRVVLLLQNDSLRQRMGRAGRRLVEGMYSWTRIAEMTERLYERLV
jgi:glycosyltransferase involved in cell wall biosynthesis